ncbi:MAG: ABC transporter ATP-binding protein [Rhodobacteraceae bacterium]|jgi:putative spermidine/putrescine transport system ATP-binding protein|uniref:Putative spermidine/putrescine transport system ATP-binding protein n=1 Tax=Salipiger profundus TaxID=1229727 RepID=A0A1U7D9C4_9RHOB|nr:putative spermidine/putrescine transport system ATP-binding protein [Salipiger profundus]MAB06446.1 ABC transporter ATP-binding protein [Paracoccaceae bacterium]GFZ96930.1 ABC transporter ATP-binding protein [Salipiger profundus]SFB79712.1 putative spermidine/putrescine transport system ATP-binding protein [Salipiger profundus]
MKSEARVTDTTQIEARSVGKKFGKFNALRDVSLQVANGEFLSLLGPSGSGKTTFLTLLGGYENATSGKLFLDGQDMTGWTAKQRGFGMVFQGYALFPHLTVAENIAFPLKVQKRSKSDIKDRVARMVEMVGLSGHEGKRPRALSGGQQQRVALARALAYEPEVLLLDEPFSALDKNLRGQMQEELRRLHRDLGTTFVFVTHDQEEALALSTRIAIFNHGELQQVGTPDTVYERPANRFTAEFLGDINILSVDDSSRGIAGTPLELPVNAASFEHVAIRPEHMRLADAGDAIQLPATVRDRVYLGSKSRLLLETRAGEELMLYFDNGGALQAPEPGADIRVTWETGDSFAL